MCRILLTIILFLSTTAAMANITGNRLKEACQFYPGHTEAASFCIGYISGSLDAARGTNNAVRGELVCEPPNVVGEQLIAMAIKYLSDHPELLHLTASSLILDMYVKAFPCKKKSNWTAYSRWAGAFPFGRASGTLSPLRLKLGGRLPMLRPRLRNVSNEPLETRPCVGVSPVGSGSRQSSRWDA